LASRTSTLERSVVVLGLGRFGQSIALELMAQGTEVLGIDCDERLVQSLSGVLTHVVAADTTDVEALRQLSVGDFKKAVVGIGTDLEASILTTSALVDLGVNHIWAKAVSNAHAKILSKVGAQHVIRPEHDMGKRVAHLVRGSLLDYIEFDDGYAMVKTTPPSMMWGRTLADTGARGKYGITIVGVKRLGQEFTYATPETVLERGDLVIVAGARKDVESFAAMQ
jgi:trk system potassium uptake protein TrkA